MSSDNKWPFDNGITVIGMKLPEYLNWAAGTGEPRPKKLLLPPIQRGFIWRPVQIAQLWDSLLRGMPIGSLMVSELAANAKATEIGAKNRKIQEESALAIGLLDGQQRTLAMLLGWKNDPKSDHCVWLDLGEKGINGSPFELRISTRTQPFGYSRNSHQKLQQKERREARMAYDGTSDERKNKSDYELFRDENIRPWKGGKSSSLLCFPIQVLWHTFREKKQEGLKSYVLEQVKNINKEKQIFLEQKLGELGEAFQRLDKLDVPLILVPEYISQPPSSDTQQDTQAPLTLLFERIGRNGAALSSEDLLFSMIKQQWPEAHDLVNTLHSGKVGHLMSATDCVMTAYRLAMAEEKKVDTPRPSPNSFHLYLGQLIQESESENRFGPLRLYLQENSRLQNAFNSLYNTLKYNGDNDIGLPDLMLPHLPRSLIQVLLRWFMLNESSEAATNNRTHIIAFTLFWYLCIWHDDNSSRDAFSKMKKGDFPASNLYKSLVGEAENDGITGAWPLIDPGRLTEILVRDNFDTFRNRDTIFKKEKGTFVATYPERELFKRFCWWRKPVLLWLQRKYVHKSYSSVPQFVGLTDEDAVPYDYDHLCPQNHWGVDWRNISKHLKDDITDDMKIAFKSNRSHVGNSIGNLHVLDSSLNRSFGDAPIQDKINYQPEQGSGRKWNPQEDSLILHKENVENAKSLWLKASPRCDKDTHWDMNRLAAFQEVVQLRTLDLYSIYYDACKVITPERV